MARTLELDTITEPNNSGTANITLSSNTTTAMPLVDINGGAIDGTTVGAGTPSSVAATTLTASGATTLNGNVTLGNASADTITVTGTMAGVDNKSGMTGEVRMWSGSSAPTGWLFCNGAAVSRSTYSALFAITSTGFGVGDGSSTFNVPDMKGRVPVGVGTGAGDGAEDTDGGAVPAGTALTARSLGEWTGTETIGLLAHTHAMKQHTHTMQNHTHDVSGTTSGGTNHTHGTSHNHTIYGPWGAPHYDNSGTVLGSDHYRGLMDNRGLNANGSGVSGSGPASSGGESSHTHTWSDTSSAPNNNVTDTPNDNTSDSTGSTTKHTIPIMCINFIIKT